VRRASQSLSAPSAGRLTNEYKEIEKTVEKGNRRWSGPVGFLTPRAVNHLEGEQIESCAVLTTNANELAAAVHNRMPVILPAEAYDAWLDPANQDTASLQDLLRPYPAGRMRCYPVSTWVNNPRHDDPRCVEPAA
jgi:putative SOS response-associated peptidase YedK